MTKTTENCGKTRTTPPLGSGVNPDASVNEGAGGADLVGALGPGRGGAPGVHGSLRSFPRDALN